MNSGKIPALVLLIGIGLSSFEAWPMDRLGTTPGDISGTKTPSGILLTSSDPANSFTMELIGDQIKPLSSERLLWRIDGKKIELLVSRRDPWVLPSASDIEVLRDYQKAVLGGRSASSEEFSFPEGKKALLWSQKTTSGNLRLIAATANGSYIIVLTSGNVSAGLEAEVREYLRKTLLSFRRGAAPGPTRVEPKTRETGMALQDQMRIQEALTGQPHSALLNSKLMTPVDSRVRGTVPLDPTTLTEVARLMLESGEKALTVSVFDGRVAHTIILRAYDFKTGVFHYWDPWGKGSFLERENNNAEVSATPHPTQRRIWLVKSDELEHVLYSIVATEQSIIGTFRLCTLLAGPPEKAISTYRTLHKQNPNSPEISAERFDKLARRFLRQKETQHAMTMFATRWVLFRLDAGTASEVYDSLRRAGESDPEGKLKLLIDSDVPVPVTRGPPTTLESAKKTDFFTFFNWEQTATTRGSESNTMLSFRPASPHFHQLAELKLNVAADGTVMKRELAISGSLIADPARDMFARDIVKSFLQFAVAEADAQLIADLVGEIWRPDRPSVLVPGDTRMNTAVPVMPSLGYMVYLGAYPEYEQTLPASMLHLHNTGLGEKRTLEISVQPR